MSRRILATLALVISGAVATVATQEIFTPSDDITLPVVVRSIKPVYTAKAMDAQIEGVVRMEIVVLNDGKVGDVTVSESLDVEYGLDTQAVEAARQWLFKPGMKDGKPVAVRVTLEMRFTLK